MRFKTIPLLMSRVPPQQFGSMLNLFARRSASQEPPLWLILITAGVFVFIVLFAGQLLGQDPVTPLVAPTTILTPTPTILPTAAPTIAPTVVSTALPEGTIVLSESVTNASFGLLPDLQQPASALFVPAQTGVLPTGEQQAGRCRVTILASQAVIWLDCSVLEVHL